MSSFGAKRKAKVIKVDEEEGSSGGSSAGVEAHGAKEEPTKPPLLGSKAGRKPFRQSGLRKTFSVAGGDDPGAAGSRPDGEEDSDGPVVVRPSVNRHGSAKQKPKGAKPRLSFGGDPENGNGNSEESTASRTLGLGKRALENSAARRGIALRTLPARSAEGDDRDDRPRYSKEYLEELQSSTPSTPRDVSTLHASDGDEMELDPSELEGALVVELPRAPGPGQQTQILSEAEIRERKERRARLAEEHDFLSVGNDDADGFRGKKDDKGRLIAEDEDLGEGFDDYVEDGGLSLGKRAERERRKRERKKMAELITAAEGHDSDDSSDSDAERRIAYEASQSKAGLDGLKKPQIDASEERLQVPSKITPLPDLGACLTRLRATLQGMESELKAKSAGLEQLRKERQDVDKRKAEVQALLDETGKKYQEAMMRGKMDPNAASQQGPGIDILGDRGLDSLGTTPSTLEPVGTDVL
ncbi:uncharacterized protein UV8b_01572 [Ustilaginoidea virens]|uniref:Nineteen complex-related protein 2 domain-containing protein n=1 Tax=Ustilaginoidea virens TaxID=1159556 RepID=A0A8E5MFC4_USTVR|nr:uncharacterized protein UV8b_01572 [Ustilaginoidea virens]QUC17331.1 hypothetical protein UV8b_01572 [Ustilaginoidea virens]